MFPLISWKCFYFSLNIGFIIHGNGDTFFPSLRKKGTGTVRSAIWLSGIWKKRVPILPFVAIVAQGHHLGTFFSLSVEYCIHYSCYWQHIFPWILYESPNIQTIIIFTLVFFFSLSLLFSFSFSFFMFFFLHFYIFCFYFSFFILRFCFCTLLFHFIYLFFFLKQFFGIFTFTRKGC